MWAGYSSSVTNSPATPAITDSLGTHLPYTLVRLANPATTSTTTVGGQAALWTAPVGAPSAMSVTVTNQAASGYRQAGFQVLVLTGADAAAPVQSSGVGSRTTAVTSFSQSYTPVTTGGTGGGGFMAVADWNANASSVGAGGGCTVYSVMPGGVSYVFLTRASFDDVAGVGNTVSGTLGSPGDPVLWAWADILPDTPPLFNSFAGGTAGVTLAGGGGGNTGGVSGDYFDIVSVGAGGTVAFSATGAVDSPLSCEVATGSAAAPAYVGWSGSFGTQTAHYGRVYLNLTSLPGNGTAFVAFRTGSGSWNGCIQLTAAGHLLIQLPSYATNVWTSAAALSTATEYRIEWNLVCSTTTGGLSVSYYAGESTTAIETFTATYNLNWGTNCTAVWLGWCSAFASQPAVYLGNLGLSLTGWLGRRGPRGQRPWPGLGRPRGRARLAPTRLWPGCRRWRPCRRSPPRLSSPRPRACLRPAGWSRVWRPSPLRGRRQGRVWWRATPLCRARGRSLAWVSMPGPPRSPAGVRSPARSRSRVSPRWTAPGRSRRT